MSDLALTEGWSVGVVGWWVRWTWAVQTRTYESGFLFCLGAIGDGNLQATGGFFLPWLARPQTETN
jgi:hypothetical protein